MSRADDFGKIAVLAGGPSSERDVSIRSGRAVYEALKKEGCDVVWAEVSGYGFKRAIKEMAPDIAFLALHGKFGEDGTVQKMLEQMAIPYTGSGVSASRVALDKISSKRIFMKNGIPTPPYIVFEKNGAVDREKAAAIFGFPLVVKPSNEGSSIGLNIATDSAGLKMAVSEAFKYSRKIIIEKFIESREITVGILGKKALPVVEIVPKRRFYDYLAKYKDKNTKYIVPAKLPKTAYRKAQKLGLAAHRVLGCKDFSRVDMLMADSGEIFVLEVNTIPGLTSRSLLPKAAGASGVAFNELCLKLLRLASTNKKTGK